MVTGLLLWPVVAGDLLTVVSPLDFLVAIGVSFPYTGEQGGSILVSKWKVEATLYTGVHAFYRAPDKLQQAQFLTNKE